MQGKARHGTARHGKARQGKARQGKARQGKARQGKARQGKARQGKARQHDTTYGCSSTVPAMLSPLRNDAGLSILLSACPYISTWFVSTPWLPSRLLTSPMSFTFMPSSSLMVCTDWLPFLSVTSTLLLAVLAA
jgi:hypothetical protein